MNDVRSYLASLAQQNTQILSKLDEILKILNPTEEVEEEQQEQQS